MNFSDTIRQPIATHITNRLTLRLANSLATLRISVAWCITMLVFFSYCLLLLPPAAFSQSLGIWNNAQHLVFGQSVTPTEFMRLTTDGNLGIGTTSPAGKLHVNNDVVGSDSSFVFLANGNAGIGTTTPSDRFEIEAPLPNMRFDLTDNLQYSSLNFAEAGTLVGSIGQWGSLYSLDVNLRNDLSIINQTAGATAGDINFHLNGNLTTPSMIIKSSGNVGIGTTSPGAKLDIEFANFTYAIRGQRSGTLLFGIHANDLNPVNFETLGARDLMFRTGTTNNILYLKDNGNIGIGTTTPTNILSFGGDAARTIWMERKTAAGTGNALLIQAGGAQAGAVNTVGGQLQLSSGISTGSLGSAIAFLTASTGAPGSTDNIPTQKMVLSTWGALIIGQGSTTQTVSDILLIKDGHFNVQQTTAPTIAVLPNAGTGATASVSGLSTDNSGQFTLTSTITGDAIGDVCTITFNKVFTSSVIVIIAPANGVATTKQAYVSTTTTSAFTVGYNVLPAAATCVFNYLIIGNN